MYVRQAKQFLKTRIQGFDERQYGFASVVDLLRAAAKEGVLKLERDRHRAFRVFAGPKLTIAPVQPIEPEDVQEMPVDVAGEVMAEEAPSVEAEAVEEPPIMDAQPVEAEQPIAAAESESAPEEPAPARKPARKRKSAGTKSKAAKVSTPSRRTRRSASTRSVA
jgi:hypothetical protein